MLAINPHLSIALFSADQRRELLKECISSGIQVFIDKDQGNDVLCSVVRGLCQKWATQEEVLVEVPSERDFEKNERIISSVGIIGRSEKMAEVAHLIKCAAKVNSNVLIQGESGTGKEVLARSIHFNSARRNRPFIPINMTAITDTLVESELFGHLKGAFTGALMVNKGKFLAAQGGTIFLDEIGDMKPEMQVKLLRVLQERKLTPVGGTTEIPFDVRIIAATNVNLEKAIAEGRFREDLYYRLHILQITMPPLRDRPQDIQPLIHHFLKIHNGRHLEISMKVVRLLEAYQWRGNVRELENEIEKLVSLGIKKIEPSHLSQKLLDSLNYAQAQKMVTHNGYQAKLWGMELEYLENGIRLAGSLREACRSIFFAAPSSIHTRINILKTRLEINKGEVNEHFVQNQ
jgi:transcriptional regulator with PAS, ATPase and Fis domain